MYEAMHGTPPNGNWYRTLRDGKSVVVFICPKCSGRGLVGSHSDHSITLQGEVQPSVVCDCGFHEYVKLLDWTY